MRLNNLTNLSSVKLYKINFGIDNVPYLSQTGYNGGKIKKRYHEFTGSTKSEKSKVCDR